jgi:hypothetical protein
MKFPVFTKQDLPMEIKLCFYVDGVKSEDDALFVRMYVPDKKQTDYHRRRVPVQNGENCVILKTPIVPDKMLMAEINRQHGNYNYELTDISAKPIFRIPGPDSEWMAYAEYIAANISDMNTGTYYTKDSGIKFLLVDSITDEKTGKPIKTPARVYHDNGDTEININEFLKYSVFVRMFILMHERAHYLLNTRSETEADRYAADVLLQNGYPKIEIVYAATKIFPPESQEMRKRADNLVNYIYSYGN